MNLKSYFLRFSNCKFKEKYLKLLSSSSPYKLELYTQKQHGSMPKYVDLWQKGYSNQFVWERTRYFSWDLKIICRPFVYTEFPKTKYKKL
jgi:hypothetical protein